MLEPVRLAIVVEFVLTALAKWRDRGEAPNDTLARLARFVPVVAFAGLDLLVGMLVFTGAFRSVGLVVAAVLAVGGIAIDLVVKSPDGCGCFGSTRTGHVRLRAVAAKVVILGQAVAAMTWAGTKDSTDVARVAFACLTFGAFLALQPAVVSGWWPRRPLTIAEAVRAVRLSPQLDPWRATLLRQTPSAVIAQRSRVQVVLDAWGDDGVLVLVATVTRYGVRIEPHHAATLEAAGG